MMEGPIPRSRTSSQTAGGQTAGAPARGRASANLNRAKLRTPAQLNEKAPETFKAKFETTKGDFVVEVHRDWAPIGADRFYNLVKNGFFDGARFFRVLENFMAQWGMTGDPAIDAAWTNANIKDDPVTQSNKRGFISFGNTGLPNSRNTQVFINFKDNSYLDASMFAPFGQVVEGMEVVDKLYSGYGRNNVPDQNRIRTEGNAYLTKNYPMLDSIKKATIVQ